MDNTNFPQEVALDLIQHLKKCFNHGVRQKTLTRIISQAEPLSLNRKIKGLVLHTMTVSNYFKLCLIKRLVSFTYGNEINKQT